MSMLAITTLVFAACFSGVSASTMTVATAVPNTLVADVTPASMLITIDGSAEVAASGGTITCTFGKAVFVAGTPTITVDPGVTGLTAEATSTTVIVFTTAASPVTDQSTAITVATQLAPNYATGAVSTSCVSTTDTTAKTGSFTTTQGAVGTLNIVGGNAQTIPVGSSLSYSGILATNHVCFYAHTSANAIAAGACLAAGTATVFGVGNAVTCGPIGDTGSFIWDEKTATNINMIECSAGTIGFGAAANTAITMTYNAAATNGPTIDTTAPTVNTNAPTVNTTAPSVRTGSPTSTSAAPTVKTKVPTIASKSPTLRTSNPVSSAPTDAPTTVSPTPGTSSPTRSPTKTPTSKTASPTRTPTGGPTRAPTRKPTGAPQAATPTSPPTEASLPALFEVTGTYSAPATDAQKTALCDAAKAASGGDGCTTEQVITKELYSVGATFDVAPSATTVTTLTDTTCAGAATAASVSVADLTCTSSVTTASRRLLATVVQVSVVAKTAAVATAARATAVTAASLKTVTEAAVTATGVTATVAEPEVVAQKEEYIATVTSSDSSVTSDTVDIAKIQAAVAAVDGVSSVAAVTSSTAVPATTEKPTKQPTKKPTMQPVQPTTRKPTRKPTKKPTVMPVVAGSVVATFAEGTSSTAIQNWADAYATKYCAEVGIIGSCTAAVSTSRRLLSTSAQIKIMTDPTQVSKFSATSAASTAKSFTSGGVTPTAATAARKDDSVAPSQSPTPQPTISWQSRFLFWIWLTQFLSGIGGWFGF